MTVETSATEQRDTPEINFRKQADKFQRMIAEQESRISDMQKQLQAKSAPVDDEDRDDDPYIDKRKLDKTLTKFAEKQKQETLTDVKKQIQEARDEARREMWIEQNSDFNDVMQHAQKLAETNPSLAKTILTLPDTFERQQLVYNNIKALNLHKPQESKPSIQETINANRRSPYYQPSGMGAAPYASAGDFSESGQKAAHTKMMDLKNRLRLG